jgi:hypothetical protein
LRIGIKVTPLSNSEPEVKTAVVEALEPQRRGRRRVEESRQHADEVLVEDWQIVERVGIHRNGVEVGAETDTPRAVDCGAAETDQMISADVASMKRV